MDEKPPHNLDITDDDAHANRGKPASNKLQKAVALSYSDGHDDAPKIAASGQGHVAEQILQLAFAHGIKVREDAELVDILGLLEVDSPVPVEVFAAVAEILAYVYQANASAAQRLGK
jgi:flagellar biosynthesis protein